MKISVIIPVYNEEESIAELHSELEAVLNDQAWDAEIIMVDDGSSDRSAALIADISARDPREDCRRLSEIARELHEAHAWITG